MKEPTAVLTCLPCNCQFRLNSICIRGEFKAAHC